MSGLTAGDEAAGVGGLAAADFEASGAVVEGAADVRFGSSVGADDAAVVTPDFLALPFLALPFGIVARPVAVADRDGLARFDVWPEGGVREEARDVAPAACRGGLTGSAEEPLLVVAFNRPLPDEVGSEVDRLPGLDTTRPTGLRARAVVAAGWVRFPFGAAVPVLAAAPREPVGSAAVADFAIFF